MQIVIKVPNELKADVSYSLNLLIEHYQKERRIVGDSIEGYYERCTDLIEWCTNAQKECEQHAQGI